MFREITTKDITANEIKYRILAYDALKNSQSSSCINWSGNLETYTLNLRLSGILQAKPTHQDNSKFLDRWKDYSVSDDLDCYIYQSSSEFLRDTQHHQDIIFVDRMYLAYLQRQADTGGREGYVQQLHEGRSRKSILLELRQSPEAYRIFLKATDCLNDIFFIKIAYQVHADRILTPNQQEQTVAYFIGEHREDILFSIQRSQEFNAVLRTLNIESSQLFKIFKDSTIQDYYQNSPTILKFLINLDSEQFLQCLYQIYLNREADRDGLESYLQSMMQGLSRELVLDSIQQSEEGKEIFLKRSNSMSDRAFVRVAFRTYLQSKIQKEDMLLYLTALKKGQTRSEVLKSILYNLEEEVFQNEQFGIFILKGD